MKILGLIPARGGSKGIPRKNLAMLCGKPLIQWTIEAAKASRLDAVYVTTDDYREMVNEVSSDGIGIIRRPPELATDDCPVEFAVQHALREIGEIWDMVMLLQPTNPLRTSEDIDGAITLSEINDGLPVLSVFDCKDFHPSRVYHSNCGRLFRSFKDSRDLHRQDQSHCRHRDGSIYLHLFQTALFGHINPMERYDGYLELVIPRDRSVRIDEPFDLEYAEFLLTRQQKLVSNT